MHSDHQINDFEKYNLMYENLVAFVITSKIWKYSKKESTQTIVFQW